MDLNSKISAKIKKYIFDLDKLQKDDMQLIGTKCSGSFLPLLRCELLLNFVLKINFTNEMDFYSQQPFFVLRIKRTKF